MLEPAVADELCCRTVVIDMLPTLPQGLLQKLA